jgi:cytochrome bd-I ubiquinol oxidase subunit X
MWYFAWILGIGFAVLLSIVNAMWYEAQEDRASAVNGNNGSYSGRSGQEGH